MTQRVVSRQLRVGASTLRHSYTSSSCRPLHYSTRTVPRELFHLSNKTPLSIKCRPKWYSTTPRANAPTAGEASAAEESKEPPPPEESQQKELESRNKEIIDLKDKYLRSVADFRNLQERTKRDVQSARDFAITRFAKDLIESIDNLDRALSTVPAEALQENPDPSGSSSESPPAASNKDLTNLYSGLKMTEQILMATLQKHGLERFDPSEKGQSFNPNLHEATFQTKVEGKEDGTVFHTQQKGFLLNGRVIRAAKVGVVKNS